MEVQASSTALGGLVTAPFEAPESDVSRYCPCDRPWRLYLQAAYLPRRVYLCSRSRYLAYSSLLSSSRRLLPSCFDFSLSSLAIHRATYLPPCCFVAKRLLIALSNLRSTVSTRHLCQSPPFREPPGPLLDLQSALCLLDRYGWLKRPHPSAHEQQNGHRRPT